MNAVRQRLDRELMPKAAAARRINVPPWLRARRVPVRGDDALPDALESMARSLRAGTSLRVAIAEAGASASDPLGGQLREVASSTARGRSLPGSLDWWVASTASDEVALAAAALVLAAQVGGTAAKSLDAVADTIRDRSAVRAEVRALSSQARASAAVIALAPIAFAALVALADPASLGFLVTSRAGLTCLVLGVTLDVLGVWWMRGILARAGIDRDAVPAQQADVVDLFVLAIGAGLNAHLALVAVAARAPAAWRPALEGAANQVARGTRVGDALHALPQVLGEPARPIARVIASADRYGTPLLPALERLAAEARQDRRRRAEEHARRVPVKLLFPLVLCALPGFGLLTVAPLLAGALDALRL